jgi:hypothetical protein
MVSYVIILEYSWFVLKSPQTQGLHMQLYSSVESIVIKWAPFQNHIIKPLQLKWNYSVGFDIIEAAFIKAQ